MLQGIHRMQHLRRQPVGLQLLSQLARMRRTGHHGKAGREFRALRQHQVHLRGGAQRKIS
jgi:hypothetical protein